jgi:hypothetical protein
MFKDTAFIVLGGASVENLSKYADRIPDDVLLCSVNEFFIRPKCKLNRSFDFIHFSMDESDEFGCYYKDFLDPISEYSRTTSCKFVTSPDKYERFLSGVENIIVAKTSCGRSEVTGQREYNSAIALIIFLAMNGVKRFVIFGWDGYGIDVMGRDIDAEYKKDADVTNRTFWDEMRNVLCGDVSVTNVNYKSGITCFPMVSYEEFFR